MGKGKWLPPVLDPTGPMDSKHWTHSTQGENFNFDEDPNLPPPGVKFRRGDPYASGDHLFNTWIVDAPQADGTVTEQVIVDYGSIVPEG